MILHKLTKSYSTILPTYEPIPSELPIHDHKTGSPSCKFSGQHSIGVARITVQSAELRKPKGWKRLFHLKPNPWVKVKVLGRTKGGVEAKSGRGEITMWRENRIVGCTDVRARTYSPNFDFKSYYALIGPYEKHLELEVRNKRRWMWPFANDSIVGTASFLLPTSHPLAAPSVVAHSDLENEEQNADWGSRRRKHAASRLSARSSVASSLSHTVHADEVEPEQNEWAVQAPLLNKEMNRIEGYLLFNVFWYPAVPMEFRPPTYSRREEGDEGSEGDGGGGSPPTPGVVTLTLHSINKLNTPEDREVTATISMGWRLPPMHTAHMLHTESHRLSRQSTRTSSGHEDAQGMSRSFLHRSQSHAVDMQEEDGEAYRVTTFDSTFEFLCVDPSSTNIVLKVFETYQGMGGRKKEDLVGHTSVPLRDLIIGQNDGMVSSDESMPLIDLDEASEGQRRSLGRDRWLSLLEHPTGKARVCVEWRALKIPEGRSARAPKHG